MPKIKKNVDYYIENFRNYNEKLPWNICTKILIGHYGCEIVKRPGSARIFIKDEIRVTAHEPHGREKFVSKKDRERIIKYLINIIDPPMESK